MAGTTAKRLLCCEFRRTDKAMDKIINTGGAYVEKYTFSPGLNITCFTFYIYS
jgi:hypothetical protein